MAVLDYAGLQRYDGKIKQYTGDLVDTVVEVTDTQPSDEYNKIWITPSAEDVELAEMSDVDELKSAFRKSNYNESVQLSFERGNVDNSGEEKNSTTRLRTEYLHCPLGIIFTVPSGFKVFLRYFSSKDSTSLVRSSDNWQTGNVDVFYDDVNYVRIILAFTGDGTIDVSDVTDPIYAILRNKTDNALIANDNPAEAKETGDYLKNLSDRFNTLGLDVNYGYNFISEIPEIPYDNIARKRYGIKQESTKITLNCSTPALNVTIRIKISGELSSASSTAYIDEWTQGIILIAQHTYKIIMRYISGIVTVPEGEDNPKIDIFNVGTHSPLNVTESYTGLNYECSFVAPTEAVNLAVKIGGSIALENAVYQVTLEDVTAKNEYTDSLIAKTISYKGALLSGADFDDITSAGTYQAIGAPIRVDLDAIHRPTRFEGDLLVLPADNVLRLVQIYVSSKNVLYHRVRISGVWTNWISDEKTQSAIESVWGVVNTLQSSAHLAEIKWTPLKKVPKVTSDDYKYFAPLEEQTGIPYSSVRDQDKAVGMDVSFHTFMTAVHDPNSVLYTRKSTVSNSATYYGTICSGMVNYSLGIGLDLTNDYLAVSDMFETIPMIDIEPGDVIWVSGHIALVYDTGKDDYGRINKVVIREQWSPTARTVTYNSWTAFMNARDGYIARRFKNIHGVGYNAIPYVQCFDETEQTIVYPDVQTDHGDKAVFMVGENVKINVINNSDFTTITVKKGETIVYTTLTISEFTLESVQPGLYTIIANGGESESVSSFFVVDATASFDQSTGDLTFSTTNAKPVLVNVYNLPQNRRILCKPIILTDDDMSISGNTISGQINVLPYMDENYQYAKVTFLTDYGTAVWYSETHEKWVSVT